MAKVLISVDDSLLRRVDRAAHARGVTRSAYFAGLARHDLDAATGPGAQPEVHAALADLDVLFAHQPTSGDSTALIRAQRDERV